ncbi:hypothetical protein Agub_g4990 [Astrephomene gubernaculifera]|uniref:Uncharacterized protein n=1 Tax=Astrephomene gubernaculifera TaxID=47775 RepID=A0AAD3DN81_9CHLO|nr:hypothetical protein Agub_g4990 [Astrephomene gubernaculifera]
MLLERQQSSAQCSTSYTPLPEQNSSLKRLKRRQRVRCSAQLRPHHVVPSSEQALPFRHAPLPRPAAASASTAWAPSSSPQHRTLPLPPPPSLSPPPPPTPDLLVSTRIPSSIPSLEDLQHLHQRASTALPPSSNQAGSARRRRSARPQEPHHDSHHHADPRTQGPHARSQQQFFPGRPGGPRPAAPPPSSSTSGVMQLTLAIKAVRDWRRLPHLLSQLGTNTPAGGGAAAGTGGEGGLPHLQHHQHQPAAAAAGLDPFNAAALLTHLAQRVALEGRQLEGEERRLLEQLQSTALAVVDAHLPHYRARQLANVTWALARLGLPAGAAFIRERLLPAAASMLPWYEPQHLSNTLWALAAAGVPPSDGWLAEWLTAAFPVLQRRAFAPQHLANVLWALERLGVMPDQEWLAAYYDCVSAALPACNPQDCSNILSALALLGLHARDPQPTRQLAAGLGERLRQLLLQEQAAGTGVGAAREKAPAGSSSRGKAGSNGAAPPSRSAAAAASAALDAAVLTPTPTRPGVLVGGLAGDELGPGAGAEAEAVHPAGPSEAPSPAAADSTPASTAPAAASAASGVVAVSDQSLANSMWALAVMGCDPGEPLWGAVGAAMLARLQQPGASSSSSSSSSSAAAAASGGTGAGAASAGDAGSSSSGNSGRPSSSRRALRPSSASSSAAAAATTSSTPPSSPSSPPPLSPAALCLLLWSAASLQRALPGRVMAAVYGGVRRQELAGWEPRTLATMVWSLAAAPPDQPRPPADWVSELLAATAGCLPRLGPQAASSLLYGLGQLGVRPPPGWMSALLNHLHRGLAGEASSQSVSNVLWCLAKMGYRLAPEGMDLLLGRLVGGRLAGWAEARQAWQQQGREREEEREERERQEQGPLLHHHYHQQQQREQEERSPDEQQQQQHLHSPAWLQPQQPSQHQEQHPQRQASQRPTMQQVPPPHAPPSPTPPPSPPPPPPPFSAPELSSLLYSLALLRHPPPPPLSRLLLAAARARLGEAGPRELSNMMWSLAALELRPSDAWLDDFFSAALARLPHFHSGDLAQTLYGAAKLRLPLQLPPATPEQQHPHLHPPHPNPHPPAPPPAAAPSDPPPHPPTSSASRWLSSALHAAPRLLPSASAQELCNLAWALVQLGVPVGQQQREEREEERERERRRMQGGRRRWASAAEQPQQPQHPQQQGAGARLAAAFASRLVALSRGGCEPGQLALGVWALGKWGVRPSEGMAVQLEVATFRMMPSMRSHELAAMLSGFAGMRHTPPPDWLEEALQHVLALSRQMGPHDWTVVLLSLSRLQARDASLRPRAEELLQQRLLPRLGRLPLVSLVLLSYSCGCMGAGHTGLQLVGRCIALLAEGGGEQGADEEEEEEEEDREGGRRATAAGGDSGVDEEEDEGEELRRLQLQAAAAAPAARSAEGLQGGGRGGGAATDAAGAGGVGELSRRVCVSSLRAAELGALLWSAVRVGMRMLPRGFRDRFFSHTQPLLPSLPGSLLACFLWSAGRLRLWAPGGWRLAAVVRVEAVLPELRARELAMTLAGLVWLRLGYSRRLLCKLSAALTAQEPLMAPELRAHARGCLGVLQRRLRAADRRERRFGARRVWVARVRGGLERAAREKEEAREARARKARAPAVAATADVEGVEGESRGGKECKGKGAVVLLRPIGRLSRRKALRESLVRRRPSRVLVRKSPEGEE